MTPERASSLYTNESELLYYITQRIEKNVEIIKLLVKDIRNERIDYVKKLKVVCG